MGNLGLALKKQKQKQIDRTQSRAHLSIFNLLSRSLSDKISGVKEHEWRIWLLCCLINLFLQTQSNSGKQATPRTLSHELNISRDHSLGHIRAKTCTAGLLLMAVCLADAGPASIGSCRQWEAARRRQPERSIICSLSLSHLNNVSAPLVLPAITYGLPPMVQQQGSLIIGRTAAQSEKHCSFLTSLETAIQPH